MNLEQIDKITEELKEKYLTDRKLRKCPKCGKKTLDIEHYKNCDGIQWYIYCQNTDCDEFHVTIHSI